MPGLGIEVADFFDTIFGKSPEPGWVTLATYPDGIYDPSPQVGPTKEMWFAWPRQRDDLVATVKANHANDLYFCPVLFAKQPERYLDEKGRTRKRYGRRKDNAKWLGVVYADADDAQPEVFRLEPTITVRSSQNKHHLYWSISDTEGDVVRHTRSGQVIAYAHEGCDLGGWDITQLLRVPTTTNNKPSLPQPWKVAALTSGQSFTMAEIDKAYEPGQIQASAPQVPLETPLPKVLPEYGEVLAKVASNSEIVDLLHTKGRAPKDGKDGNRSQLLWLLLCTLAREGLTKEETFVLSWEVNYNKSRLRGHTKSAYWQIVCKAYAQPDFAELVNKARADPVKKKKVEEAPKAFGLSDKAVHLLTAQEHEGMPITLVDKYIGWAGTKTDAAKQYHEAAAFTILSSVYGEFGKPATRFDSGGLNTWFMVLGGTTMSRKSTVRNMMTKTIRHLSDDTYQYDVGSNATPEGLHAEMLDRPGLTSLFHRDEVHGLVGETKAKSYLAGLQELMTELYDGHVPGKLRATGNKKKSAGVDTNFCVYLTGATDHVTEAYEMDDFASGHLARFMYVYAEPPQRTKENSYIHQAEQPDPDAPIKLSYGQPVDKQYQYILKEIKEGRDYWAARIKRGKQQPIFWEADAWERMNDAQHTAMQWADNHPLSKALTPTTQRSMIALIRLATVLAMAERAERVQMRHLLRALKFTEECLTHLTVVLSKIQRTNRGAAQDEVLAEITVAGPEGITYGKLFAKFRSRFSNGTFRDITRDLREAEEVEWNGTRFMRRE